MKKSSVKLGIAAELLEMMVGLLVAATLILGATAVYFLNSSVNDNLQIYEEAMYDGYRTEIKSQVQAAVALVESYYNLSQDGVLSEDEAKRQAAEAVRSLRYRDDRSGYMWIDGFDYTLVMHPILPDQEGNNRFDLTDQNGVKIIQNIISTVKNGGTGYNEFYFTKADGVTVAPKLAYSE